MSHSSSIHSGGLSEMSDAQNNSRTMNNNSSMIPPPSSAKVGSLVDLKRHVPQPGGYFPVPAVPVLQVLASEVYQSPLTALLLQPRFRTRSAARPSHSALANTPAETPHNQHTLQRQQRLATMLLVLVLLASRERVR